MDDIVAGYNDSDWAGKLDNHKNTMGFCFYDICTSSISWASNIQKKSSMEAEVYASFSAAKESVHLKFILAEFSHPVPSWPNLLVLTTIVKQSILQSEYIILEICAREVNWN